MPVSNAPLAFLDCYSVMDRAIADPVGIRVGMPSEGSAIHFRMRCNQARVLHRKENAKTYPVAHNLHGRSPYDTLVIRLAEDDGEAYVYFEKHVEPIGRIESLSGTVVETTPQARLAPPLSALADDFTGEAIEITPQAKIARRL